jgi:copper-binding protein NosD
MTGTASRGIYCQSFTGGGNLFDHIGILGNKIHSVEKCIEFTSGDSSHNGQNTKIIGNKLTSNLQHISYIGYTTPVTVVGNTLSGTPTAAGMDLSSSTKVCVTGNSLEDFTSGYALKLNGTQGILWDNNFARCTNTIDGTGGGEILGLVIPTWTGTLGARVQMGNPSEAGSAASKYIINGWMYTTSWLQLRTLTGN